MAPEISDAIIGGEISGAVRAQQGSPPRSGCEEREILALSALPLFPFFSSSSFPLFLFGIDLDAAELKRDGVSSGLGHLFQQGALFSS